MGALGLGLFMLAAGISITFIADVISAGWSAIR